MPRAPGARQLSLFAPSRSPLLQLDPNHRLVRLTEQIDWLELEAVTQEIRLRKLKSMAGRPPHLRENLGAVILKATRQMTYREVEDQIRHYGPARYLCGLTDSTWTPDHTTVHDFMRLLGEDGFRVLNEVVLRHASDAGLLDYRTASADTTAQEAPMSYPTEVGLMDGFLRMVSKATKRAGTTMREVGRAVDGLVKKGRYLVRKHRFFDDSKEDRISTGNKLLGVVKRVQRKLGKALKVSKRGTSRLEKYANVARRKLETLHRSMKDLAPQIAHWLETGWVAKNKIVNLLMPEVRSIPRGKVGKDVEFGVKWGLTRLSGGLIFGEANPARGNFNDTKHVVEAVDTIERIFGDTPTRFAYDRGGHSRANVETLRERGVAEPGLAPAGSAAWPVDGAARRRAKRERVKIEGSIGALKSRRYNFNRPNVRSTHMMMTAGQGSVLGYNLNRLVSLAAARDEIELVGA